MIVSRKDDVVSIPRRKRGVVKAVSRSVPGSDVVSAFPMQTKNFNISKHIAKPFIYDPKMKGNYVPLKCDQLFSHVEGASLFNAPVTLVNEKLDVPSLQTYTALNFDSREDVDIPFTEGLAYKMGIRPSHGPRLIKTQPVPAEPTNPYPDRPAGPGVRPSVKKMTYSVGKLALEALSR